MRTRWLFVPAAMFVGAVLLAVGCGGGGDSNDNPPDTNAPPDEVSNVDVDHTYTGTRSNDDGSANVTLNFNQSGDVLTGSFTDSSLGNGVISGTVEGDHLEFTTVMSAGGVIIEWKGNANASGTNMNGTWKIVAGGTANGDWSASR